MNSFNHYAYGAISEWMYSVIGGLQIDEEQPGYKHMVIEAQLRGDLTFVKVQYESIYGTVKVKWHIENDQVTVELLIPINTTATLRLSECKEII